MPVCGAGVWMSVSVDGWVRYGLGSVILWCR